MPNSEQQSVEPASTADWCGRDACPACQGYDDGPRNAPDCPWLGEPLPDAAVWK